MPRVNRIAIELNVVQVGRFWSKVNGYGSDGCWLWGDRVDSFGYGHFKLRTRTLKAHRVAWTLKRGPIPDDKTLDHLCRTPRCVNPAHLALVSNKQNILRGASPTAINALKTHCSRGHELTGANIRTCRGKRECRLCEEIRRPSAAVPGKPTTRE